MSTAPDRPAETYFAPGQCPVLVVKIGSALLVESDGKPRAAWVKTMVEDIARRRAAGQAVIIVSSGAVAMGARRLGLPAGGRASLADAQAAASVGQVALTRLWSDAMADYNVTAAQMLVTLDDLEDRRRYLNITATLGRLLTTGAVPVINENDSVATEEIRFGDNDRLAARVAQAAGANGLIILSDVDGLYTADPGHDAGAEIIPSVDSIDDKVRAMASGRSSSGMGSGGMASKIDAADIATRAGIATAIISGREMRPLDRFAGAGRGTVFLPAPGLSARKGWLDGRLTQAGTLQIDDGAAKALKRGSSLLAAGIVAAEGDFRRGDMLAITDGAGQMIARGLAEYDAKDVHMLMGHRNEEHTAILGYAPRSSVVHRNHMVLV